MTESKPPIQSQEIYPNIERVVPFAENQNISTFILGMDSRLPSDLGWTLREIKTKEDFETKNRQHVLKFLLDFAKHTGVKTFLAPVAVPQNGEIMQNDEFENIIDLGEVDGEKVILKRSQKNFEGCEVKQGEMFINTSADCLTLMVRSKSTGKLFAAHAGRESIFDVANPDRPTIMKNFARIFDNLGLPISDMEVWCGFGVTAGEHFKHDETEGTHADQNRKRRQTLVDKWGWNNSYKNGHLNKHEIVRHGFIDLGVPEDQIATDESLDTLLATDENGKKRFFSHRRDAGQKSGTGRNMVGVVWL